MRIWQNIRHKWYNWRQYRNNIKFYKKFLKSDAAYDNISIYTFLTLKLQQTASHYGEGLFMPYEDWKEDYVLIERALFLSENLHHMLENDFVADLDIFIQQNNELFDILKNCHRWWD